MISAPPGSKLALPFLVVPLGSLVLITIVTPLAGLLSCRLSRFRAVRWPIRAVVTVVMLCVIGITVLLGLLLLDHNRDTTLPTPTGAFAVGRTTYVWRDASQTDPPGAAAGYQAGAFRLDLVSSSASPTIPDRR